MIRKTTLTILSFLLIALSFAQTANFTAAVTSGCSPVVVNFQDQSIGAITSWFWDFGNGATSTLKNPSTTYFTPGNYSVTLTVSNGTTSNTLTRSQFITVYGKPGINFTVNDSTACYPHRAQFTDLSSASPGTVNNSWFWDFGDGSQSTSQNPMHVYTSSGNYTVTLKVTNDKGCYSVINKTAYIRILGGVISDFTSTTPNVCRPPFNISFTNNSTGPGGLSWFWDFGDGTTSTQQNPTHSYTTGGNFTVKLATTSTNGCSDTLRKDTLFRILNINTAFNSPDSVCINTAVNFLNNSSPSPITNNWSFGDGATDTARNPSHTYTALGLYNVKLVSSYSYCTDSVVKQVRVMPRPVANFTQDVTSKCQPSLTVNFQDQSTNAVGWLWIFGDGSTSTQQNASHTYTSYGDFDVRLVVRNSSGCTDTLLKPALIKIRRPVITLPSLPVRGCIPYSISPVANIVTQDVVTSYLWNFGDGGTSTSPTPNYTYNVQGIYTVTLTITTAGGCTETYSLGTAVKVGAKPTVNFSGAPTSVCAFQAVQFTNLTDKSDEWYWDFGDGSSTNTENPSHLYSDTGFFTVKFYASNVGCMDSLFFTNYIKVKPPVARFGFTTLCSNRRQFTFLDSSLGAFSWSWNFGDGNTSTLQNPNHTFASFGEYTVSLTVTNDTCSHTMTRLVRVINESPDITVSPNPTCKPNTVYFKAAGTQILNIASYTWDVGFGTEFTTTSPETFNHYSTSGLFTIRLVTTDIYGCTDTIVKPNFVRIFGPTATFNATNTIGCRGLTTTFNDLSTNDGVNNIVSWKWDFGDGTVQTYTSGPFTHRYDSSGKYTVRLQITDAYGCIDSAKAIDLVQTTYVKAGFYTTDTLSCPGGTVKFLGLANVPQYTSYWEFGDGNTSTNNSPWHQFANTGVYTIKQVITDPYGCVDSVVRPLLIRVSQPVAGFTMNDSASSCNPFEVQFTNTSTFYESSLWDLGGGMSTLNDPIQFYNAPGVYPIKLIVTSPGGCKDSAFGNVTVFDTSLSSINYLPLDGCKPLTVNLNSVTPGTMNYTWDFGDGVLVNTASTSISHVYNFFGDFVPKVIMYDPAGCIIPVAGRDTISIKGATAKFGIDRNLFCDSGMVRFRDSTIYNDSLSVYNWNFGDGGTSNLQNPTHYYTSPGLYDVSLNVVTQNACVDTFRIARGVKVVESPLISVGGDSVICIYDTIQHLGVFDRPDTSAVQWTWQLPNGSSSSVQNPMVQYGTAGTFVVRTTAVNSSGCRDSATKNILVNPLPTSVIPSVITMQAGFPVTIPATYSPLTHSYMWSPSNTLNCTDCPQPIASPKFNTKYTVTFTDSNSCRNTGQVQIIVICKDANAFIPNTFSPNGDGSNDVFYVRGRGLDRVKSVRIFNRWGEVVFEKTNFPVNDPVHGWDGKFKGNKPVPDVYIYQIEVFCDNSQVMQFKGNIALIQ